MDRALVVVDASESSKDLLRRAGAIAAAMGAELTLLHVTSEEDFEADRKAMAEIGTEEYGQYHVEQAESGARQFALDIAGEVLADTDVEYEALGTVGDTAETVLSTVEDRHADHVFIAGRKRSPTGKAIFGDAAQRVILNANVPVTIVTEEG